MYCSIALMVLILFPIQIV